MAQGRTFSNLRLVVAGLLLFGVCSELFAAKDDANLNARLAKLERALDNRGLIDLLQQVESLQTEVQRLRGQIEEQNKQMIFLMGAFFTGLALIFFILIFPFSLAERMESIRLEVVLANGSSVMINVFLSSLLILAQQ